MRLHSTILAFLCSCSSLLAQKPLSIGDTLPDIVFENLLNHSSSTARLSDFKGKLVILDFWATWCTSCLHAFPKMDSLQSVFSEDLKILLVNTRGTGDDLSRVEAFLARYKARTGKELSLTTVVGDTISGQLFPHHLLPHYVWITKSGRVMATTSSEEVTAAAIRDVLDGIPPSFVLKKDQDTDRPLFSGEDLPASRLLNYAVLVKGWFEGLPSGNRNRDKDGVICGRAMANTALLDMYKAIIRELEPAVTERQIIIATEDSSDLVAPLSGNERDAWYKENAYTLDMIVPQKEADHLYANMLAVLNQYSGYTGRFEVRKLKCWVLVKKHPAVTFSSKGGKTENRLWDKNRPSFTNGNISVLVSYLSNLPAINGIVFNETRYTGKIDLAIKGGFSDLKAIRENLDRNGLKLKQAERRVKVFDIRKE
jgi:thiol-disulfide isomerase/thioredoxin